MVVGEDLQDLLATAKVALHQGTADSVGVSGAEIIERDGFVAPFQELPDYVTSDVTGAAGDEHSHG